MALIGRAAISWPPPIRLLVLYCLLMTICQLADAACTAAVISTNQAIELNPLMAWLLNRGPWHFLAVKAVLAAAGSIVLGIGSRRFRWVWTATKLLLVFFLLLVIFHVVSLALFGAP